MAMITAFLQSGTVDMSTYINADKTANGDTSIGSDYYESACASCHGDDGRAISFGGDFVGTLANGNPWEPYTNQPTVNLKKACPPESTLDGVGRI